MNLKNSEIVNVSYIEQFYKWSKKNPKKVSNKNKILLKKLVGDIKKEQVVSAMDPDTGKVKKKHYVFDINKAHKPIKFIEKFCTLSKGLKTKKHFELDLFQKAFIESVYGFVDKETGFRKYQKAELYIGRKNGKSTLAAALGLYHLFGEKEYGAEVYSVATKLDQAEIVWNEAVNMIKHSKTLKANAKLTKKEICYKKYGGIFKPLPGESFNQDGLNASFVIADEIHAWTDFNLLNVMFDSMSSREQPLMLMITTMGFVRESVFDKEYEIASEIIEGYKDKKRGIKREERISWVYELDSPEEILDPECWYKANPGLGSIKKYSFLENKVKNALNKPEEKPNILTKDFNIAQIAQTRWLTFDECKNQEKFNLEDFRNCYAVGGVDLSSTTDLTCATILIPKNNNAYVTQMYFIPEMYLERKIKEDKIPYDIWEKQGLLRVTKGTRVDYSEVTKWFNEIYSEYEIAMLTVGYDPWSAEYWVEEMKSYGFDMTKVIQGAKTMSTPMKILKADLQSKKVIYNDNPILHWNLTNTEIKRDVNDNIRPVKGKKVKERIDGAVSLIDAYVVLQWNLEDLMILNKENGI